jgi:hypothetical protein
MQGHRNLKLVSNLMLYAKSVVWNCELSGKHRDIISSASWLHIRIMLHDGGLCSAHQCCSLPSVRVHMTAVSVMLLLTIFMLEIFSFGLQTWVILSKYAYCMMRFC